MLPHRDKLSFARHRVKPGPRASSAVLPAGAALKRVPMKLMHNGATRRGRTPSPRLRGEGWGEGDSQSAQRVESPPHPTRTKACASTSPRKRGEVRKLRRLRTRTGMRSKVGAVR